MRALRNPPVRPDGVPVFPQGSCLSPFVPAPIQTIYSRADSLQPSDSLLPVSGAPQWNRSLSLFTTTHTKKLAWFCHRDKVESRCVKKKKPIRRYWNFLKWIVWGATTFVCETWSTPKTSVIGTRCATRKTCSSHWIWCSTAKLPPLSRSQQITQATIASIQPTASFSSISSG